MAPILGIACCAMLWASTPLPTQLRLTGTTCHPEAESRVFALNGTLRGRGHWSSEVDQQDALHISWTPATRVSGGTMLGGWRIDRCADLGCLQSTDRPRIARANFDSDVPPFGTNSTASCEDQTYCTEQGGAWREHCDGEYGLKPIVLQQKWSSAACAACATGCPPVNGSDLGVICDCCPANASAFVPAQPPVCAQQCPAGTHLKSPGCVWPPVCAATSNDAELWVLVLFLALAYLHSRMKVTSWVKDIAFCPNRGEESLSGGLLGLLRRIENSNSVRRLQQARQASTRLHNAPSSSSISSHAILQTSVNVRHDDIEGEGLLPELDLLLCSGWLFDLDRADRVFVRVLKRGDLEVYDTDAEDRRKLLKKASLRASVVAELPAWTKSQRSCAESFFGRLQSTPGQRSRRMAADRYAYGFTIELATPDADSRTLYTLCDSCSVTRWTEACLAAASKTGNALRSEMLIVETTQPDDVPLRAFHAEPVDVEIAGGALHVLDARCRTSSAATTYVLTDYTVELIVSFSIPAFVRALMCLLHEIMICCSPLVAVWPALTWYMSRDSDAFPLHWWKVAIFLGVGTLLGLPTAWIVLRRVETIDTFALVPRKTLLERNTNAKTVVIRTASKFERDVWMNAAAEASTGGIRGFSLAYLKRFVAQNSKFMKSPGREYVTVAAAKAESRRQTGKIAPWDPSLVEVYQDVSATTTNTAYDLIKPMTESKTAKNTGKVYVQVAEEHSEELEGQSVTELYSQLFDAFAKSPEGIDQTGWTAFLNAVHAPKGDGDISYQERDRQREFWQLKKAASALDVELVKIKGVNCMTKSDFCLLYRLRCAMTDWSMWQSHLNATRPDGAEVPSVLYLSPRYDCGPATVFVSHTWNRPFTELIESLELEERRQIERAGATNIQKYSWPLGRTSRPPLYWIDIFQKDQWAIQGNDTMAELVAAIVGPGHVLVIGDGWAPIPVCLTRVWCLYEILNTIDNHCALNFAVFSGAFKQFQAAEAARRQSVLKRTLDSFDLLDTPERFDRGAAAFPVDIDALPIDVRNADATVASDKQMIFNEIEKACGHDAVNKAVKASIQDARTMALEAEHTVRSAVWKEVWSQAMFMCLFWLMIFVGVDQAMNGGPQSAVNTVAGQAEDNLAVKVLLAVVCAPITLGTLVTASALIRAKRRAQKGAGQPPPVDASDILRQSVVLRDSQRLVPVGGSHSTAGKYAASDEGVPLGRTPSGRESLSQPTDPSGIFHTPVSLPTKAKGSSTPSAENDAKEGATPTG